MWILRDHILKFLKWQRDMFWYLIEISKFSLVKCKNLESSDKCFDKFWLYKLSSLATWNSGTKRWWYLGPYMSLSKLLTLCKLIMKQIWRARETETLWLGDRVAKMYLGQRTAWTLCCSFQCSAFSRSTSEWTEVQMVTTFFLFL